MEIEWPPYSPHLNVLNYFFWLYAKIHLRQRKLVTIEESKVVVKDIVRTVPVDMIRVAVASVWKRCQACIQAEGLL